MALQEPKLYALNEVLYGRIFRVPPYQRGYSWTRKERNDLFRDLEQILKAIEKNLRKNAQQAEAEKVEATLVKEKKDLILLQTNLDARDTLDGYLRKGNIGHLQAAVTIHQKELMRAFRECEQFVVEWGNPIALLNILKNKIKFVYFVLQDAGSVYRVFEVLNSRGLNVYWLDKMKSTLMGVAFEKKKKLPAAELEDVENEWTEIYRSLGKGSVKDDDALTIAANLSDSQPPGKGHQEAGALEFFRNECSEERLTPLDVSRFLRDVVRALDRFLEDPRHRAVCRVKQARLLAAALLLSPRLKKDSRSREKALDAWEKSMYRLYVLAGQDSRRRVGECVRLASEIVNGNLSDKAISQALDEIGSVTFEEASESLKRIEAYREWTSEELIYFFWKYEESLVAENGEHIDKMTWAKIWEATSTEKSVEHIYPQKDPYGNWKGKGRHGVKTESFVHRLGNLLVLPPKINAEAGTNAFPDKVDIYKKKVSGLYSVKRIIKLRDWNLSAIERREKDLLRFAHEQWW